MRCAPPSKYVEFFLNSITAAAFLTVGHKRLPEARNRSARPHWILLVGVLFSSVIIGALLVAFFIYGPRAIGSGIDEVLSRVARCGCRLRLVELRGPH